MDISTATWQIWIDTGGTFTDCLAITPEGEQQKLKVLSSSCLRGTILEQVSPQIWSFSHNWKIKKDIFKGYSFKILGQESQIAEVSAIDFKKNLITLNTKIEAPDNFRFEITANEEAPILAARMLTQTPITQPLPPIQMKLGSTKGTNALLEKKGAKVTLLITEGFEDLLKIGTQQRPDLFQLTIPFPQPLYEQVLSVPERVDAHGTILKSLHENDLKAILNEIENEVVVIALLNSYLNPAHENQIKSALQKQGFQYVSVSNELSPTIKILPRTQTALVNGYLSPVIENYITQIQHTLNPTNTLDQQELLIMTSSGGLAEANVFHPKDSLLSGPAGGVIGAITVAKQLNLDKILTLDMGGTSTDTARFDGKLDYNFVTEIGNISMSSPTLAIETVAAGGGSICYFDGTKLCVGPESASAHPGPACYGAGGPLTITDVNLLLGKLDPQMMEIPIDLQAAQSALESVLEEISAVYDESYSPLELLEGFEQIANQKMSEAIKKISVEKGFAPKEYSLVAFGGAGGMHACKIAEALDMESIVIPGNGGILSAYGIGNASIERIAELQINQIIQLFLSKVDLVIQELWEIAFDDLSQQGLSKQEIELKEVLLYIRFIGQDSCLEIPYTEKDQIESNFLNRYQELFGYSPDNRAIEVESIKLIATSKAPELTVSPPIHQHYQPEPSTHQSGTYENAASYPVFRWESLEGGATIAGPAVILNNNATTFLEKGWELTMTTSLDAVIQKVTTIEESKEKKEAVELELFTNRFTAIAEEMGAQLQRTAFSVNIKERLDYSCAILDPNGYLLVNAPHIPVHLGSLGICARLIKEKVTIEKGDVIITNHPKYGGSHLPDITLLSGVFTDDDELIGYVINRAHHSEIGGKRPGSMPPDATTLAEEGVVITPTYLKKGEKVNWDEIHNLLLNAPFPTRALNENIADIKAALASLKTGQQALIQLTKVFGLEKVHYYMQQIKEIAKKALQETITDLPKRVFRAKEALDDEHEIQVKIEQKKNRLLFDFTGTSKTHPFNLNANQSIVYSAVIYVIRLMCDKPIPLNGGLMELVDIKLPKSLLNPVFKDDPSQCPAVVGGNTEISQRLVDTLLKALELAACSQGTMNNFLFGNKKFGYYETIGGGVGATSKGPGRSATHQHMTNTKITDPEELELKYPVRLIQFGIRKGSGGPGKWNGGDGIIREIEFLDDMEMTFLSQHRKVAPYGMAGGYEGKTGQQYIIRTNGWREYLKGVDSEILYKGDRMVIKTPGGGGWGPIALETANN